MRRQGIISEIDRPKGGVYLTIVISALVHVALFCLLGFFALNKNDITFYSPPYSVSLVPGVGGGVGGEGGEEFVEEYIKKSEPVSVGGTEIIKTPSEEKNSKKEETKKEEKEVTKEEVKKETTKDLESVIESIRKKVELDEEKKRKEEKEHELLTKEKLKEDVAKTSPAGGGATTGGGSPSGTRSPLPGSPGGGSPYGSDNVYSSGGSGMGVSDMEFQDYYNKVWKRIKSMWAVPEDLLDKDLETVLGIRISRDGKILDVWMESASGDSYFDDTAERAVKKSDPLPPLPEKYSGRTLDMGIRFHSKKF